MISKPETKIDRRVAYQGRVVLVDVKTGEIVPYDSLDDMAKESLLTDILSENRRAGSVLYARDGGIECRNWMDYKLYVGLIMTDKSDGIWETKGRVGSYYDLPEKIKRVIVEDLLDDPGTEKSICYSEVYSGPDLIRIIGTYRYEARKVRVVLLKRQEQSQYINGIVRLEHEADPGVYYEGRTNFAYDRIDGKVHFYDMTGGRPHYPRSFVWRHLNVLTVAVRKKVEPYLQVEPFLKEPPPDTGTCR